MPISYGYNFESSKLFKKIDSTIKKFVDLKGAKELIVSPIVSKELLCKLNYIDYHLDKLIEIKQENGDILFLTPAACLNVYKIFENQSVNNQLITVSSNVFRNENDCYHYTNFNVREVIALGNKAYVQKSISDFLDLVNSVCKEFKMDYEVINASDLFFPSRKSEILQHFQINSGNKKEIVVTCNDERVVIGSINYHGNHFSKALNFDKNDAIVTACVGFGLERILYVLEEIYG